MALAGEATADRQALLGQTLDHRGGGGGAGHGTHTPESVMGMLADHGTPEGRICLHDMPAPAGAMPLMTMATGVMAPARRTMWVAAGPACREPFTEVRL